MELSQKMWCIPKLTDEYIERMEDILDLYDRDYNKKEPIVCLDEKPIQLLEDLKIPKKSVKKNVIKKRDYQYNKLGIHNCESKRYI